jgi:hypothetical protein
MSLSLPVSWLARLAARHLHCDDICPRCGIEVVRDPLPRRLSLVHTNDKLPVQLLPQRGRRDRFAGWLQQLLYSENDHRGGE